MTTNATQSCDWFLLLFFIRFAAGSCCTSVLTAFEVFVQRASGVAGVCMWLAHVATGGAAGCSKWSVLRWKEVVWADSTGTRIPAECFLSANRSVKFEAFWLDCAGKKVFFTLLENMAVALKPRLKALQASEPLSPSGRRLFCSRPLSPSNISNPWENESKQKAPMWLGALLASHRNRSEEEGRPGEEVRRLAGSQASSNISVNSVLCLARPTRPGDVTNVLDYQVVDGNLSHGSFFSYKR